MITQDEELDNLLPPGPCTNCRETFPGKLLDDDGLCMACDIIADDAAYKAERDAEDAALYKEGMRIWEKALTEVQVLKLAEDDLWVEEQWQKLKPEWEKQEAEQWLKHLEETNPWEALKARERTVKDRELSRRENRQNAYDAAEGEGQPKDSEEPLAAFEMPMDGSELDLAPTAMLRRKDGSPLLYKGKLNFIFGTPGGGKSWVGLYCVEEMLLQDHRVGYWDFEDTPSTLKRRASLIGLDLPHFWADGQFKYLRPGLNGSTLAMSEAMEWVAGGDGPTLIVIDSAESAGCPADGSDVAPWLKKTVRPFLEAGCTVLVIDHIPKRKESRPMGPIGSQHKLARIDGAALLVTGIPWTQKTDGHLVLTNHKDRHGMLPSPIGKAVARMIGTHENGTLNLSIVSPENQDNLEEAYIPTLRALASAGPDGVHGQKAMRDLVVGRNNQKDKAIGDLVGLGFILKTPGKPVHYSITALGLEELGDVDDEG